jgi:hypothetical protein
VGFYQVYPVAAHAAHAATRGARGDARRTGSIDHCGYNASTQHSGCKALGKMGKLFGVGKR